MSQYRRRRGYEELGRNRRNGWGVGLYRRPSDGWFGGVCAGFAAHWEVPTWVTRLSAFALLLVAGPVIFWIYIAAWILISKQPSRWEESRYYYEGDDREYDEDRREYRRKAPFRYSEAPSKRLDKARDRVLDAERRVSAMERYVTSRRYELSKEISSL